MRRLFTFAAALVVGLMVALVTPAQAVSARSYAAKDAHGDVQKWNGGHSRHPGRTIDIRRVTWRVSGHGENRRLSATLWVRKVWANGGERESFDFAMYRPGHGRSVDVLAFGPFHHGKPVLMTVGRSSDTRHFLGCSSLRQAKHPATDTVTVSLRLSCLPQRFRTRNMSLRADSGIERRNTEYWFDQTPLIRHASLH